MAFLFFVVLIFYKFAQCNSSFIIGNEVLSYVVSSLSVGYDNKTDTIFLFGGSITFRGGYYYHSQSHNMIEQQFITFNNNQFIDQYTAYMQQTANQVDPSGQHYTQIDDKLWMINPGGDTLFMVDTRSYLEGTPPNAIPIPVQSRGCLASSPDYLFIVGAGYGSTLDIIQIYEISTDQWLHITNTPNMNQPRGRFSCLVKDSLLFAIGGFDGNSRFDSIEVLDIANVNQIDLQQWNYLFGKLSKPLSSTRAVLFDDNILVIGGATTNSARMAVSDVNIIYPETGECVLWDTLAIAVDNAASIIVDNTLFVFGGYNDVDGDINKYQYKILLTESPMTMKPTSDPSAAPSGDPSTAPSVDPSTSPPNAPNEPSDAPSIDKSDKTEKETTNNPTSSPHHSSNYPTDISSRHPTPPTRRLEAHDNRPSLYNTPTDSPLQNETIGSTEEKSSADKHSAESQSIIVAVAALVICALVIYCSERRKRTEQVEAEHESNIVANIRDIAMEVDDHIEMAYTDEGPQERENKDSVTMDSMDSLYINKHGNEAPTTTGTGNHHDKTFEEIEGEHPIDTNNDNKSTEGNDVIADLVMMKGSITMTGVQGTGYVGGSDGTILQTPKGNVIDEI
eukprot:24877_1